MPLPDLILLILTGLMAGLLGGLLGIGGSVIMIPVLTILLDRNQHLSQASAMIVNVAVSLPAAYRHQKAKAVRWDAFRRILPFGLLFIIIGVEVSDLFEGRMEALLQRIFGVFLLYVIAMNILEMLRRRNEIEPRAESISWWRCGLVGMITGFMAGLLGIGGGIIAVPLLQRVCGLPLRQCIATSSAVMVLTAVVGAVRKNMTLDTHVDLLGQALNVQESVLIAACLAPTAILGGLIGARLTHALPLNVVRLALLLLLALGAGRMILADSGDAPAPPAAEATAADAVAGAR